MRSKPHVAAAARSGSSPGRPAPLRVTTTSRASAAGRDNHERTVASTMCTRRWTTSADNARLSSAKLSLNHTNTSGTSSPAASLSAVTFG
ncbi:phage DNA packaging protein J [Nocardia sp. NPDC023852]|uniref:phage DNA packaging protein J n=1 Tax=Nocardia sp. NPDC023852 TaxID=3154697 RepID=UPI0033E54311